MLLHGTSEYSRSDNDIEFTASKIRKWLKNADVITVYTEPGSFWKNGFYESFNARMRDGFWNRELLGNMIEAEILAKRQV